MVGQFVEGKIRANVIVPLIPRSRHHLRSPCYDLEVDGTFRRPRNRLGAVLG